VQESWEARGTASRNFLFRCYSQAYYVYTVSAMLTGTWQPYVKNYAPNPTFDFGGRAAALWLDR
jgi:hypothetical protein